MILQLRVGGILNRETSRGKCHPSPSLLQLACLNNWLGADLYKLLQPTCFPQVLKQSLTQSHRLPEQQRFLTRELWGATNSLSPHCSKGMQEHTAARGTAGWEHAIPAGNAKHLTSFSQRRCQHKHTLHNFLISPSCPANYASWFFPQATSSIIPPSVTAQIVWDAMYK